MFGLFAKLASAVGKGRQPTYRAGSVTELPQYLKEYLLEGEQTLPVSWGTYTHRSGKIEARSTEVINTQLYRTQMRACSALVKRDRERGRG